MYIFKAQFKNIWGRRDIQ